MYIIVVQLAKQGGDHKGWEHYADHRNGRSDFQIDLGLALIEKGICMDWPAPYDEKDKPARMRQTEYVPCHCQRCFFCKAGKTTGIAHKAHCYNQNHSSPKKGRCSCKRENIVDTARACKLCRHHKTRMGCSTCRETVCTFCWPTYQHKN